MTYPANVPNVCVIGKAGAGKTTIAQLLIDRFPDVGFERLSFAAPIKIMLGTTTDRDRMQEFGTEIVRAYAPDAWANLLLAEMTRRTAYVLSATEHTTTPRFVVDDCRFPNELAALKRAGFVTVRVVAPIYIRVARLTANGKLTDPEQLNHVSETALDTYEADHRIVNDGAWPDDLIPELTTILNRARS